MKTKRVVSLLLGIMAVTFSPMTWAAGDGGWGGGGGFVGGGGVGHGGGDGRPGSGEGRAGGAEGRTGGGFRSAGAGFRSVPYYYSRGMHFTQPRSGQFRAPVHESPLVVGTNRESPSVARPNRVPNNLGAREAVGAWNNGLLASHITERHDDNWHGDWDRRHAHYDHRRFFVFIDGSWCGLDDGFFPWDYYPYYAYDYYPYDYYPGYYADSEPYYSDNGVYSGTPTQDPTVAAVQTDLSQKGYYGGPVDGIYGPATRDAVAKYQIARELDVTGSLSPDTLRSLGLPPATAS